MSKTLDQIENYIQLHTAEMENEEYLEILHEVVRWANRQIAAFECSTDSDNDIDDSFDE